MSSSRSSSVRPCGGVTVASHCTEPSAALTATTLPLSKPHNTRSPLITGLAVPRSERRGTCCSVVHSSCPSSGLRACSLPSTVRTATSRSEIAAGASTSPLRRTFQRLWPVAESKAKSRPSLAPATTSSELEAVPPERGALVFACQMTRPLVKSRATTSPLWPVAKTRLSAIEIPWPSRSTAAPLSPMLWPHRWVTCTLGRGSGVSFAGSSTFLSFEQAAINTSTARAPRRAFARLGFRARCSAGMVLLAGGRGGRRGRRGRGGGGRRRLRRAAFEIGDLQLQECRVTALAPGALRAVVFAKCGRLVSLGVIGVAAYFVVAGRERARIGYRADSGERAVRLALCNLHPCQPLARDQRELVILRVLGDRGELVGGVIELGLIHVETRGEQTRLVGVGRAAVIALQLTEQHQRLRAISALECLDHLHVLGAGLELPSVLVALPPAPPEGRTDHQHEREQHRGPTLAH